MSRNLLVWESIDRALAAVENQKLWSDVILHLHDMTLCTDQGTSLIVGEEQYFFDYEAYVQFCVRLGIPSAYVKKTPISILKSNIEYWMQSTDEKWRFVLDDRTIKSILKYNCHTVTDYQLMRLLKLAVGEDAVVGWYGGDFKYSSFSVFDANRDSSTGVFVANSLSAAHPLEISACVSDVEVSAISTTPVRWSRRIDDYENLDSWVSLVVTELMEQSHELHERVNNLRQHVVSDSALISVLHRYRLPHKIQNAILDEAEFRPIETLYDVASILSNVALDSSVQHSTKLLRVIGSLADDCDFCEVCLQLV